MPHKSPVRADHKRAGIAAIRRGELAIAEVAQLLGVGKSTVSRWCTFDVTLARRKHMIRVWRRAIEGRQRITKSETRRNADWADGVASLHAEAIYCIAPGSAPARSRPAQERNL